MASDNNDPTPKSKRIASIDWMRGFVMILMVIDHVSMAFNDQHLSTDAVYLYTPGTDLPDFPFFTRWISHLCAPTFVFLAGTALAISIERKVARGISAQTIDMDILKRGAFIAILDPTVVSLFSGRFTIQVLYAIGVAMMCMALLRRLPTPALILGAITWLLVGEVMAEPFLPPELGVRDAIAALFVSSYASPELVIKYPLLPWLAVMLLGWAFGRYLLDYREGRTAYRPTAVLGVAGGMSMGAFALVRGLNGYGNILLLRGDHSLEQWLHVSKYPPSASFLLLEIGLLCTILAMMMVVERKIGVRERGPLLVFGQTAMFFYLLHRVVLEGLATWAGLRGFVGLWPETWAISALTLVVLYPLCIGYREVKAKYPGALWARYI